MSNEIYDVFISYRRRAGSNLASAIHGALQKEGTTFSLTQTTCHLDHSHKVRRGSIKNTPNLIPILTKGCLEQSAPGVDRFLEEMSLASEAATNIVPIQEQGFEFPKYETRQIVRRLKDYHAVEYSHSYSSSAIDRTCERLIIPERTKSPADPLLRRILLGTWTMFYRNGEALWTFKSDGRMVVKMTKLPEMPGFSLATKLPGLEQGSGHWKVLKWKNIRTTVL